MKSVCLSLSHMKYKNRHFRNPSLFAELLAETSSIIAR